MPARFVEVQPAVAFDDLVASVGSVDVASAGAGAAAAAAAAAEVLRRPPDAALWLLGAAVVLRLVHATAVRFGVRKFLKDSKVD